MAAHPPPIPEEQKSPHETGIDPQTSPDQQRHRENRLNRNLEEQGRQGNTKQNTTNKGYQQDR